MVKVVKVILEKSDLLELIKAKYPTAEVVSGLDDKIEVLIKVKELTVIKNSVDVHATIPPTVVRDEHGNIDADKSGLTSTPRKATKSGEDMGRQRGRLPMIGG